MRLGFDCLEMNERGLAVAIFDYASYARSLLGCEPVIFYNAEPAPHPEAYKRFKNAFELIPYDGAARLPQVISENKVDVAHYLRSGAIESELARGVKNAVHCVFQRFEPQGDAYAYISEWLAETMTGGRFPYVPHIVKLPTPDDAIRPSLGIPEDAVVLGRYGGFNEFNLKFVHGAVERAVEARRDLFFVFVNTKPFCSHNRVRFLPAITDPVQKANYITACDGMLHARAIGESFGLAMAEFMYFDKPVFCWAGGKDRHHLRMLPHRNYVYKTGGDLLPLLLSFQNQTGDGSWAASVSQFSPAPVMRRFRDVFLEETAPVYKKPGSAFELRRVIKRRILKARYDIWRKGYKV